MIEPEVIPSLSAQAEAITSLQKQSRRLREMLAQAEVGIALMLDQMEIINEAMRQTAEKINGGPVPPCPTGEFKELNGG